MRAVIVAASLLVCAAGCNKKGPECDAIVKVVNPAVEKLTRAGAVKAEKAAEHVAAMNEVAQISEATAGELAAIPLTVPELQKASAEYQAMLRDAASAAREVGQAVKSAEEGLTAAEKGAKDLEAAADALAKACADPANALSAPACRTFGDTMARFPEDPGKTEEAARLVAELDQINLGSKDLLGPGKRVIELMRANNGVLGRLKAAEEQATAAEKKFEGAAARETPIVDGLNKLCLR